MATSVLGESIGRRRSHFVLPKDHAWEPMTCIKPHVHNSRVLINYDLSIQVLSFSGVRL